MKKGSTKKQTKDELPGKKRGERTIAIATAVFLPSSNNGLMSDASSWYLNLLKRKRYAESL